jgi:hypothetical protein
VASFVLLTTCFALDSSGRYVAQRRWLLRCPVVLVSMARARQHSQS